MRFPPFSFRDLVFDARLGSLAAHLWGGVVGVAYALRVIGWPFLSGDPTVVRLVAGDNAAGLAAFRVYTEGGWAWPILYTPDFGESGVNVAFSDSIPLLALVAKVGAPLEIAAETWWGGWFLLVYVLQGLASVYAVRSWGGRSLPVQLAAPLVAVAMPVLAVQTVHPSLSAHFVLLIAWGLAGRARSPSNDVRLAFSALALAAMAIHPYLAAMVLAMMVGVVLDAERSGRLGRRALATWLSATAIALGLWLFVGGYLGSAGSSEGGFGEYAASVTGPFWPNVSDLLGSAPLDTELLPTQAGYSYLGLGLVVLAVAVLALNWRGVGSAAVANQGLLLALVCLSVWAISPWIHMGAAPPVEVPDALAYRVGSFRAAGFAVSLIGVVGAVAGLVLWWKTRIRFELAPLLAMGAFVLLAGSAIGLAFPSLWAGATTQFRASGRFAWPVLYAVPVLGLAGLHRWGLAASPNRPSSSPALSSSPIGRPALRSSVTALGVAVIVAAQLADTATLRQLSRDLLVPGGEVRGVYVEHLIEVISAHDTVTLGPDFRCTYYPEGVVAFIDVTAAASAASRQIDRIYSARSGDPGPCSVPQYPDLSDPRSVVFLIEPVSLVHSGNLHSGSFHSDNLHSGNTAELIAQRCRKWETINICSHHWESMAPEVLAFFGPVDD